MGQLKRYDEGDSFTARFEFYDEDRVASSPTTLRYRIDCLTSGNAVRGWTTVTAAQSVDISVTPDDNAIINDSNRTERKQMVTQTNFDTDTQSVYTTEWDVKNLQGI